ncbi:MAG: transglycosylase SLT domain-containing protein, partial [Burkholderiales bacterium]|nr:transglycosylase SLT domain-containing protein [Burkholderiales bacterium]
VARRYQVPEALIHAVITIESAYDPDAISRAGAVGLMQLMPATARRYGVANRRNPSANLTAGTRYLKDLLLRFDSNLELAIAGYNAGENAVEKFGNRIPPFDETQNYVRKVLKVYLQHTAGSPGDV